jgi:hypothetical protein
MLFRYLRLLNNVKINSKNNLSKDYYKNLIFLNNLIKLNNDNYKNICPICNINKGTLYSRYNKCTSCYSCKIKICLKNKINKKKCKICNN